MNNQDFFNLQEAYLGVYDELDENIRPTEGSTRKTSTGETIYVNRPTKRGGRGIKRQPKVDAWGDWPLDRPRPKSEEVEVVDLYDLILSHLLDEGYAETQEAAEAIMVNMSEEWREGIMEAAADQSDKQIEKGVKTTYKAGNVLDNLHQGRSRGVDRVPYGDRDAKVKRMRGRLKTRRDDLFGERNKREDESRAELKKKYGL
jgi:hypothetical protein